MSTSNAPWFLIGVGVVAIVVGVLWMLLPNFPLGRLPGDISFSRGGTRVYFPVATCLLLSVILSLVFSILRWIFR